MQIYHGGGGGESRDGSKWDAAPGMNARLQIGFPFFSKFYQLKKPLRSLPGREGSRTNLPARKEWCS